MSRLSTHVLDTAHGRPAAGVQIELYALATERTRIGSAVTNADGRAVLSENLPAGRYELVFATAPYIGHANFLDEVPVRFTISDAAANYHVPLLLSPFGYSTYRGS
jgi:5-hydroxyisourate hydrolase